MHVRDIDLWERRGGRPIQIVACLAAFDTLNPCDETGPEQRKGPQTEGEASGVGRGVAVGKWRKRCGLWQHGSAIVARDVEERRIRDDLAVEQDSEHPATDMDGHVAEAFGQGGERKQRRHDAAQHVRPCIRPAVHRSFLSAHHLMVGHAQRAWTKVRAVDGD